MCRGSRAALLAVCLIIGLLSPNAWAQSLCSSTSQCPDGQSCQAGFLGLKWCLTDYCNADSDCTRRGDKCIFGVCQFPPPPPPPSAPASPRPTGLPGEGARCGLVNFGTVIKSVGCKRGLFCNTFGICQRLPT